MQKKTKILLGVGALAVAGYFIWKNNQSKDIFANASGRKKVLKGGDEIALSNISMEMPDYFRDFCKCHTAVNVLTRKDDEGNVTEVTEYTCSNGEHSNKSNGPCKNKK
jgi:hypothetical protein